MRFVRIKHSDKLSVVDCIRGQVVQKQYILAECSGVIFNYMALKSGWGLNLDK